MFGLSTWEILIILAIGGGQLLVVGIVLLIVMRNRAGAHPTSAPPRETHGRFCPHRGKPLH